LFGAGHTDVMSSSSAEEPLDEEVISTAGGSPCADHKSAARCLDPHGSTCIEPLSLVVDRSVPVESSAEPKLEPLRAFYSHDDENYYLEPRPPRNADSAPPSFGGGGGT